jgi:peptide/nickel transport system ATP-binding protein
VGESGSGKSLTALSIMKLLSTQLKQIGDIYFEGKNISKLSNEEMRPFRGQSMAMIFQEPMTSLNPVLTIGDQIKEALSVHVDLDNNSLNKKVISLLKEVGIAGDRVSSYPDELSGGQRQRVMIAMSIACEPSILIAD